MTDETLLKFIETYSLNASSNRKAKLPGKSLNMNFREYRARAIVGRHFGSTNRSLYIVHFGWGNLHVDLPSGERQIIDTPVKGDVVGWGHFANATFSAITDLQLTEIPANSVEQAIEQHPGLHRLIVQAIWRQNAILTEHLVNAGRRNSMMRTAHFLLELEERLAASGLDTGGGYECPLTQHELADVLGLTKIHVNRTLSALRTNGLATFKSGFVEFLDRKQLVKLSGFDKQYLRQNFFADNETS
jgi:CRP-like cAMP-binding protein